MIGKFYIDGIDAYEKFGVFVADLGLVNLLQYPPMKKVDSNDWPEEDGEEFDLSSPALDTKSFTVKFSSHKVNRVGAFIESLSDESYHDLMFSGIGRTFRLRLLDHQSVTLYQRGESFSLQFADDFPLDGYVYQAPVSRYGMTTGYAIDDVDLGKYDVSVLEGSLAEVQKSASVKQNLLRNIQRNSGAIYDGEFVAFKTKEVKLKLAMMASSRESFWKNYDALLHDLSRPGERIIYVEHTGYEYPCYYKSSNASNLILSRDKIWFVFDLTLVFTSFRVCGDEYILASEAGEWIVAEDGEFAINLEEIATE